MPKPDKQLQIDTIIKWIEQGNSFDTCLKLSATKWYLTRPTFIRRWNIAKEQHTEKQQEIKAREEYKYAETMGNENSNGNALYLIVASWAGQRI